MRFPCQIVLGISMSKKISIFSKPKRLPCSDIKVSLDYELDTSLSPHPEFNAFATAFDEDANLAIPPTEFCSKNHGQFEFQESAPFEPLVLKLDQLKSNIKRFILTVVLNPSFVYEESLDQIKKPVLSIKDGSDLLIAQYEIPETNNCKDTAMTVGQLVKEGSRWNFVGEHETFSDGVMAYKKKYEPDTTNEEWF